MDKARIVLQGSLSHTRINKKGQEVKYLKDHGFESTDPEEIEYCKGQSTFMVRSIAEPEEVEEAEGQSGRSVKKRVGRPKKKKAAVVVEN